MEFLKIILSGQVVWGGVVVFAVLLLRKELKKLIGGIAGIRFLGGEVYTSSQAEKTKEEAKEPTEKPTIPSSESLPVPRGINLPPEQMETIRQLLSAERVNARLWEYRFLNYYLVFGTQRVLDWLASRIDAPTVALYDNFFGQWIASAAERQAILSALQRHYLVEDGPLLRVTPKGREYIAWRGPLPSPAAAGS